MSILVLAVFLSGCTPAEQNIEQEKTVMQKEKGKIIEQKEESMMQKETSGKLLAGTTTEYREFTKTGYEQALAQGKTVLLYFYASWCPLCKAEQQEAHAAFNEANYPNIIGFRVNYKDSDTDAAEEALAKEFGISYQHTKVILKNGERVLKAPDSWDKKRYLEEINKVA